MTRRLSLLLLGSSLLGALALSGCKQEKKPVPALEPSSEPAKERAKKDDDDEEDESDKPTVVALPPGVTALPEAAPPPEHEPRTGICSFSESSYDGMNSPSNEKLVVKVKDDIIHSASYSYRGSYAIDGKAENLDIPFREKKWITLTLKMTSGTKEFKIRIKDDVVDIKGTAADEPQGDCSWEDVDREDKRRMKRK